jgi:hypothetical protein
LSDLPSPPPVIEQLTRCGLNAGGLTIEFDDLLQTAVVTVKIGAGGRASMFPCVRHAIWGAAEITFENEKLGEAYRQFDQSVGAAEGQAMARAWLAEHGLLDRLPQFATGEGEASIREKIESFCSIPRGTALELASPGFLTFRHDFMTLPPKPEFECLLYTLMAVDLEKQGLSFGFIGNERYASELDDNAQKN